MENALRQALGQERFAITIEVVTPKRDRDLADGLAPALELARAVAADARVAALSVTDRVRSDDDHDPVLAASMLALASGKSPLVHLSGKDRGPIEFARALGGLAEAGLENMLCVTGDRLDEMPAGRRVRYLDSVEAVAIARRLLPGQFIAAGVSPFKYTEEETHNQYFKMARKHAAGADYLMTQVGWDMRKLDELACYRRARGFAQPVIATFMALPAGAARRLHKGAIPGIVVTDDLLALAEFEAQQPDRGRRAQLDRLALQVVGAERLGYAGAHLSGLLRPDDVCRVLENVERWRERASTFDQWWRVWQDSIRLPGGDPAQLGPDRGYFISVPVSPPAPRIGAWGRYRYCVLRGLHRAVFDVRSPLFRLARPLASRIRPSSRVAAWLTSLEGMIKTPLVGCQLCGHCRLPDTFYVCPERCPKGLANGPCGGSTDNTCEAGDRECIHALIYRLAKMSGRLGELERGLIPGVPEPRGGSSWLRHFAENDR